MVHLDFNPDARTVRGFSRLWFPLFVVVLGGVAWWRFDAPAVAQWIWAIGAVMALLGVAVPAVARAVFIALSVATFPIAVVMSTVVLVVMFYVVITPVAAVLRRRGHDPLRLRARDAATHWETYQQDDSRSRAVRQF